MTEIMDGQKSNLLFSGQKSNLLSSKIHGKIIAKSFYNVDQ